MCILEAGFVFASVQELKALTKLVSKVKMANISEKIRDNEEQHDTLILVFSCKRPVISCIVKRASSLDSPTAIVKSDSDVPAVRQ